MTRIRWLIPLIVMGFVLALIYLLEFLWNLVMPRCFDLAPLNFLQAAGLFFLTKLFFVAVFKTSKSSVCSEAVQHKWEQKYSEKTISDSDQ